jgi:hypothetical protein
MTAMKVGRMSAMKALGDGSLDGARDAFEGSSRLAFPINADLRIVLPVVPPIALVALINLSNHVNYDSTTRPRDP